MCVCVKKDSKLRLWNIVVQSDLYKTGYFSVKNREMKNQRQNLGNVQNGSNEKLFDRTNLFNIIDKLHHIPFG